MPVEEVEELAVFPPLLFLVSLPVPEQAEEVEEVVRALPFGVEEVAVVVIPSSAYAVVFFLVFVPQHSKLRTL